MRPLRLCAKAASVLLSAALTTRQPTGRCGERGRRRSRTRSRASIASRLLRSQTGRHRRRRGHARVPARHAGGRRRWPSRPSRRSPRGGGRRGLGRRARRRDRRLRGGRRRIFPRPRRRSRRHPRPGARAPDRRAAAAIVPPGAIAVRRRHHAVALPRDRLDRRRRSRWRHGSPTSHVAMLARSRGVPMVVGARRRCDDCRTATPPCSTASAAA